MKITIDILVLPSPLSPEKINHIWLHIIVCICSLIHSSVKIQNAYIVSMYIRM